METPFVVLWTACEQVILALGDFMNVQCHACIGGKSIGEDIRRLDYGVQVGWWLFILVEVAVLERAVSGVFAHPFEKLS